MLVSIMVDYSYDPNMPVPREIMPYHISFYQIFIGIIGPASSKLFGATVKHIYSEICSYPIFGMFNIAKNEIVKIMYSSIFPILLWQNRKQLIYLTKLNWIKIYILLIKRSAESSEIFNMIC